MTTAAASATLATRMTRSTTIRSLAMVATASAALAASLGCSRSADERSGVRTVTVTRTVTQTVVRTVPRADVRAGKHVFAAACSRCHVLERPDWTGDKINLTVLEPQYWATVAQVRRGGIAMPSFSARLSKQQIRDVAAFVSRHAARQAKRRP
jgi:mono/diheme cytochrome c family protein